jgi:chromosome segregation ATPase
LNTNSKPGTDKENRVKRLAQQAEDGKKARADYEAEGRAVREKMAKLKALRLAKEAADKELADQQAALKPAATKGGAKGGAKKKAPKEKAPPLSEWLKGQDGDGHRS